MFINLNSPNLNILKYTVWALTIKATLVSLILYYTDTYLDPIWVSVLLVWVLGLIAFAYILSIKYEKPIQVLRADIQSNFTATDFVERQKKVSLFSDLYQYLHNHKIENQKATEFASKIGEGKFDIEYQGLDKEKGLGKVLIDMRNQLKSIADEEAKRSWSIKGMAKFDQILRENLNTDIKELTYKIISNLVKYLDVNQGAVFIINDDDPSDEYIELVSAYAYDRRKFLESKLSINEGLVGQAIKEKEPIYLTEVPKNYTTIKSGLGDAGPRSILIVPIMVNEKVYGAIELASFRELEPYEIEFTSNVAQNFASTYSSIKANLVMSKLLKNANNVAEELKEKEKSLLENELELKKAQEELNIKLVELMAETNLNNSILNAINQSNACVQYDLDANILDANEMFLSVMGYTKDEIIGKNESMFVPEEELNNERYKMLWQSLKLGNFNSGEFKRKAKYGKEVWMEVTYNPIVDLDGKPFKILMFCNFTTLQKEKENEYRNKINTINECLGLVEINNDYTIKTANQFFLDKLSLKRKDLKNKSFEDFIDLKKNNPQVIKKLWENLAQGKTFEGNIELRNKNNQEEGILFHMVVSTAKDLNANTIGYYAVLTSLETEE
jgi:methyl-accepting chemotaxis protein